VQLLWHQLRVSVLVLKERLLQGLQDSNGNYTRQTDILQDFGQDQQQVTTLFTLLNATCRGTTNWPLVLRPITLSGSGCCQGGEKSPAVLSWKAALPV